MRFFLGDAVFPQRHGFSSETRFILGNVVFLGDAVSMEMRFFPGEAVLVQGDTALLGDAVFLVDAISLEMVLAQK